MRNKSGEYVFTRNKIKEEREEDEKKLMLTKINFDLMRQIFLYLLTPHFMEIRDETLKNYDDDSRQ